MNQVEFVEFINEVSASFPGWSKWLRENSPDLPRTISRWSPILSGVSTAEAVSVLARWLNGTLPAPKGYEYENFILLVKSVVGADRAKARHSTESILGPSTERGRVITEGSREAYLKCKEASDRYRDGELTESEVHAEHAEILAEHWAKI